jgi:xanthine/uracil permease
MLSTLTFVMVALMFVPFCIQQVPVVVGLVKGWVSKLFS